MEKYLFVWMIFDIPIRVSKFFIYIRVCVCVIV